ncbi:hypothetical protein HJC23_012115, partial [Cyclotella cryptica]
MTWVLLMNNKFDNSDIECIALGLSQNVSIETTILEACGVTDIGWGERVLYTLSLEENVITDIGRAYTIWGSNHIIQTFLRSASCSPNEYGTDKFYLVLQNMKHQISETPKINQHEKCPVKAGR